MSVPLTDVKGAYMTIMWALNNLMINTNNSMIILPSTEITVFLWLTLLVLQQNQYSITNSQSNFVKSNDLLPTQ